MAETVDLETRDGLPGWLFKKQLSREDQRAILEDYNGFFRLPMRMGYISPCRLRTMVKRLKEEKYKLC